MGFATADPGAVVQAALLLVKISEIQNMSSWQFADRPALQQAATISLLVLGWRVFFHPLSKFPGPWLNAASEVPEALAIITGRQHAYHRRLHERYGNYFLRLQSPYNAG
jgi:hypothetical protein